MAKKETEIIVEQTTLDNFYALAEEIKTLTKSIINNQWEIAKRLKYINDNWKEYRKNKDFPYTKFEDFIQDYYNWTKKEAYNYIDAQEIRGLLEEPKSVTGYTFDNMGISVADKLYDLYKRDNERAITFLENNPKPTRRQIEQEIKALRYENTRDIPLPDGKYRVIYCDPPWRYDNSGFSESAEQQYPTMDVEELRSLKINNLTQDQCILFMWCTNTMLREGLEIMKSWGFEYKTNFVWIKNKSPMVGWFCNSKHEMLLIGTIGGSMHPKKKFDSIIKGEVTKHSKKPEQLYDMIEEMYDSPYIELFARNKRKDWESWGNEI